MRLTISEGAEFDSKVGFFSHFLPHSTTLLITFPLNNSLSPLRLRTPSAANLAVLGIFGFARRKHPPLHNLRTAKPKASRRPVKTGSKFPPYLCPNNFPA
jgi:hypothetical protein